LPKNPQIADELVRIAATRRFGSFTPRRIDDSLAEQARQIAMSRPR
jgi:CobQ-like glutamine amidotransferase family enzyme